MDFDILNAGTALIPVVSDGLRGIFARITGGAGADAIPGHSAGGSAVD